MLQNIDHRIVVLLRLGVRLKKMDEHEVRSLLPARREKDRIRNSDVPLPVGHLHLGPVAGEIVVVARCAEPADLLAVEHILQPPKHYRPHVSHVDPGPKHHHSVRLAKRRIRYFYVKWPDFHMRFPHQRSSALNPGAVYREPTIPCIRRGQNPLLIRN